MLCRKFIKTITRILNGYADDTVRNTAIQVIHVHPILIIIITCTTYTITVISDNLLTSHGLAGLGPCHRVSIITTNAILITLRTTTRSK